MLCADLERWVSAGYTRSLAQSYLTASRTSLSNHNIALDSRLVSVACIHSTVNCALCMARQARAGVRTDAGRRNL